MSGTTGNEGYIYPTLADANDVPYFLQTLAEALDLDVSQIKNQGVFLRAIKIASPFTVVVPSSTAVNIPQLTTTFNAEAGKRYRITMNVNSHSSQLQDIAEFQIRVGSTLIGEFPKTANSGRDTPATGNYHVLTTYWTAPTSGPMTVTAACRRAVGGGEVVVSSGPTSQASLTVDDIGRA